MSKAVVLLSGGLDSSTTLGIANEEHEELHALTFLYGQKHEKEIKSAKKLAEHYSVKEHKFLDIPLSEIGKSSLLEGGEEIPEQERGEIGEEIPSTYVPARNIIFLSYALSYAESVEADAIYIGATARDYSGYPDCRPEFFETFEKMAEKGTKRGIEGDPVQIRYPLIDKTKGDIVLKADELGVPLHLTWSCYRGGENACGKCDSCKLRLKGFEEAGLEDPIEYED
ncbi:MAG: 7-cyano-7-deazaguanine synthase QueC [Candidatus Thermoplasmatota archaeon]|nr:7-cyano-7-deazaguanine synthase QueC [Candidatus Thermoplasmatota archaeon]MBS3789646.1 7-cyano-7-deazaguanine synthase QueC [Candidatus Thermoplasmatota archaeon]